MRGGLSGKRTSTLTAINYCTVDRHSLVDHTPTVIRWPDIRRECRFLPTPPVFDALVSWVLDEIFTMTFGMNHNHNHKHNICKVSRKN